MLPSAVSEWFAYWNRVFRRAARDCFQFTTSKSVGTSLVLGVIGVIIGFAADWKLERGQLSAQAWLAVLSGALGAPLLFWLAVFLVYLFRAPSRLDKERSEELAETRRQEESTVAAINKDHVVELESLRQQLAAALSPTTAALRVTPYTSPLSHLYNQTTEIFMVFFEKREFALLTVSNVSQRNLSQVVAKCRFQGGTEDFCVWAAKTGTPPFERGTHEADLSAGNSRILVIAIGFGKDELWARLPPEGQPLHAINLVRGLTRNDEGELEAEISLISSSAIDRTLSKEIPITITFQAEGFYQEERFTLGFKDGKPTIMATGESQP